MATLAERAAKAESPGKKPLMVAVAKLRTKDERRVAKHQRFQRIVAAEVKKKEAEKRGELAFETDMLASALAAKGEASQRKKSGKKPAAAVRKNKAKKNLSGKEVGQMMAVLAVPAFQSNPLAAIREHLTNTCHAPGAQP